MAKVLIVPERKLAVFGSPSGTQLGRGGLVEELHRCSGAPDPTLVETLPKGVAYHHAGTLQAAPGALWSLCSFRGVWHRFCLGLCCLGYVSSLSSTGLIGGSAVWGSAAWGSLVSSLCGAFAVWSISCSWCFSAGCPVQQRRAAEACFVVMHLESISSTLVELDMSVHSADIGLAR